MKKKQPEQMNTKQIEWKGNGEKNYLFWLVAQSYFYS